MIARTALLCALAVPALAQDALPTPQQAQAALGKALEFLLKEQNPDGSWGSARNANVGIDEFWTNPETHRSWRYACTALGCMALQKAGLDERTGPAFDRGVDFLIARVDVKRPSEWDTDNVWAYVYGLQGVVDAYKDPRYESSPRKPKLKDTADFLIRKLEQYQTPSGGWGYYDFEVYANPGMWATSFTTAVGLLALLDARDAGLAVEPKIIEQATRAVQRCRLPSGAYTYSVDPIPSMLGSEHINQIKGSLSRIQVCNHALRRAGVPVAEEELQRGVAHFFRHHRFLDVARLKPIPHEAYYLNSGYFYFFGHMYAADTIAALPRAQRAGYWPKLQYEIIKTQEADGSLWDYPINSYARPYGTAYSIIALSRSLADQRGDPSPDQPSAATSPSAPPPDGSTARPPVPVDGAAPAQP